MLKLRLVLEVFTLICNNIQRLQFYVLAWNVEEAQCIAIKPRTVKCSVLDMMLNVHYFLPNSWLHYVASISI